jgi:hypothetical protein
MNRTPCSPEHCRYPLTIGSVVVHSCNERFLEPLQPAQPAQRHLRAVS